jgi:hypothetical protein
MSFPNRQSNGFHRRNEDNLRQRLAATINLPRFFHRVDAIFETNGAKILYIDSGHTVITLREARQECLRHPVTLVLKEPPRAFDSKMYAGEIKSNPRESQIVGEVAGTTLSCGAAILSWVVVLGSSGAIPLTGGTSAAVVALSYTAAAASTAQCANGVVRIGLEAVSPEQKDFLDSQEWYKNASMAIDVISLAGAGAAGAATLRSIKMLKASSSKSTTELLRGLSRAERKRLTEEIIRANHPGISAKMMKSMIAAGTYPQRFSNPQISQALAMQLKDALGATFSFTGSASSGAVRALAVGVYSQIEP